MPPRARPAFGLVSLLALALRPCAAQARCKLRDVRRADGTFSLDGRCDELLLFGEKIGDAGAEQLAAAVGADRRLKLLDLWANGLGPKGAEALARALEKNTALQKLYLNENAVGAEGAASLARALTTNRALLTLWVSRNGLGDAGAESFAAVLRDNRARRLEALDLWGNGFTARGGAAIAAALQSNHGLRTLELRDNVQMGDATAHAFAALMPRNRALATLDLTSTGISAAGIAALLSGLKASTANPYLVIFADGLPHLQATSWEQKGQANAP